MFFCVIIYKYFDNKMNNKMNNKINFSVVMSRFISLSRFLVLALSVLVANTVFFAYLGSMLSIAVFLVLIMLAFVAVFVWAKRDDGYINILNNKLNTSTSAKSPIIMTMLFTELLIFSISFYLSIYEIASLVAASVVFSHLISALFVVFAAIGYVCYLQEKQVVGVYSAVYLQPVTQSKCPTRRLNMFLQIFLFVVYVGIVVFAILQPNLFSVLCFVLSGSNNTFLVLSVLGLLFSMIFVYANTPKQNWVAGVFFSLLSVCLMFVSFSSLLGFIVAQGVVMSSVTEVALWSLFSLVVLSYGVVSYFFNCNYDAHFYADSGVNSHNNMCSGDFDTTTELADTQGDYITRDLPVKDLVA